MSEEHLNSSCTLKERFSFLHSLCRKYENVAILCVCETVFDFTHVDRHFGDQDNKLRKNDELLWCNWNTICPLCFPRVSQSSQCSIQVSEICSRWWKMQPWIVGRRKEKRGGPCDLLDLRSTTLWSNVLIFTGEHDENLYKRRGHK